MSEFLSALAQSDLLQQTVLAGLLASVACGIIGSFVVVRRISYMAGAIAHCTLAGMGAALILQHRFESAYPTILQGATAAALIAAVLVAVITLHAKQHVDTILSALWSVGMAIGVLLIKLTPGYHADLMNYLFGDITTVGREDLVLIAALDLVVIAVTAIFYNRLLAVSFDEEFARLRGIRVGFYHVLLLLLIALTVVLLVQVVGVILVIALLILPAAAAGQFARRLWQMILLAILLAAGCTFFGIGLGYAPGLPAGATVVLLVGVVYGLSIGLGRIFRR